jgi:hypothetical protein
MVWLRDRISKEMGVQDHPDALETLMKERGDEFQTFLDGEVHDVDEMEKCIFHVYRTFYDRLVEKEVVTIEKGKLHKPRRRMLICICNAMTILFHRNHKILLLTVPRIMTPPPPVDTDVSKEKKGKKGKGKKGHSNIFLPLDFTPRFSSRPHFRPHKRGRKRSEIGKAFFISTVARCRKLFMKIAFPSFLATLLLWHFFFLLALQKVMKKVNLYTALVSPTFLSTALYDVFLLISTIFPSSDSAKKGKEIREDMAEVRPDPDIDVDRTAAETSRPSELFVLWVCFLFCCFHLRPFCLLSKKEMRLRVNLWPEVKF